MNTSDLVLPVVIGGVSWISLTAKDYFTQMAKLAVQRSQQDAANEQRRLEKSEQYFELLLKGLLMQAGEQEDKRQALEEKLILVLTNLENTMHDVKDEVKSLRIEQNNLSNLISRTTNRTIVNN